MYNCHGWIAIRINPNIENIDKNSNEYDDLYDKLSEELVTKITNEIERIQKDNPFLKHQFTKQLNNLSCFLSLEYSRNHFCPVVRDFFNFVSNCSDGSHGLLYESNEDRNFMTPERPYNVYKLIGNRFLEVEEPFFNGQLNGIENF